ncbi:MAG: rRNA maturation RNase YbeY [Bacteroidetes bacterium HGW-Bacteroidetes-9]|nr:MAG: rRNA maturation RNase YbeY [Bacteroidetes bacterium HGW-Bacteroidetes-9]
MELSRISFYNENTGFRLRKIKKARKWLSDTIYTEGKNYGEISIIFCDDAYLHEMNVKFLDHDTLTDVITFDYNEGNQISGDIFISIERVKENTALFSKSFTDELNRVMLHGVLHLCGYKDKTKRDVAIMRQKEEEYLALFPQL